MFAPFSLRPARALDAMEVARWFPTRRDAVLWGGPSLPQPVHGLWLAREMATIRHHVLVDGDDRLAGVFAVVFHLSERRAHLIRVALNPALRGKGLGELLARAAIEVASSQGAAETLTLAVYAKNAAARRTYERAGFQALARAGRQHTPEGEVLRMAVDL